MTAAYDAAEKCVRVKWTAAVDDVGILGYEIHRADAPGLTPSRDNRVGTAADTVFDDLTAEAGKNCYYLVVAKDVGGNRVNSKEAAYKAVASAAPAAAPAAKPDF